MLLTVKFYLLLLDDLLESFDLVFVVFSLVLVEFIEVVDMFSFLFDFIFMTGDCLSIPVVHVFDFGLKSLDFFS